MLSSRLIARCPSAKLIGPAWASGYLIDFSKRGLDGSGKASLAKGWDDAQTPGVLYEIDMNERADLDRFESAGVGYDRMDNFIVDANNQTVSATTYIACNPEADLVPFDWYLALIIAGAMEHKLSAGHLAKLRQIPFMVDVDLRREARLAARDALAKHGYRDPLVLLK